MLWADPSVNLRDKVRIRAAAPLKSIAAVSVSRESKHLHSRPDQVFEWARGGWTVWSCSNSTMVACSRKFAQSTAGEVRTVPELAGRAYQQLVEHLRRCLGPFAVAKVADLVWPDHIVAMRRCEPASAEVHPALG